MSLFDKDIIEQETKLEKFLKRATKWVEDEFPACYKYYHGNLDDVSRSFNRSLDYPDSASLFEKYGIYNPYFQAVWLTNAGSFPSILISIIYTEEKTETLNSETAKVFLKMRISVKQLKKICWNEFI